MRNFLILILCICIAKANAKVHSIGPQTENVAIDSLIASYTDSLSSLIAKQSYAKTKPSPYLFRIFAPGTVYSSALKQNMMPELGSIDNADMPSLGTVEDSQLLLFGLLNSQLNVAYVKNPTLFSATQTELMSGSRLRSELAQTIKEETTLTNKSNDIVVDMPVIEPEAVMPEVKRPNFWTFKGSGSLQFSQNYFSDNWYQGGEKNYSMLSQLNVEANYDNKRKMQLDNKLEVQLGFQTSETDQYHRFKATSNLLRFTSKFGYKAATNWNYAAQLQLESQPYMNYNGPDVISDFLSPLYVRSSIGMDFKIKKKRFEGSLYLSPMSYVITYVDRDALIGRHGIHEGHHSKHEWGPNVNFTFTYKMWENISWQSRLYMFTNLHLTRIEWENTLNFKINKYLSTKLFLYPRFDDSSVKYKAGEDHTGTYFMFKEWLSLGLNYDF